MPTARSSLRFRSESLHEIVLPVAALLGSMASLCVGASYAQRLFPRIGAEGTSTLRITLAAAMLLVLWRPWRKHLSRRDVGAVMLYGTTLGLMNLMFYMSIRTLPLGLTIAIEFVGPLSVAVVTSRRLLDFLWIGFALIGLALLLPVSQASASLDPVGIAFALGGALFWALYIVFGMRVSHLHGGGTVAWGMATGALVTLPFGLARAGSALLDPIILLSGLAVAVLSSALPYSLEMIALKRLPKQTFGLLLSLEPAIGSLAALAILGQRLRPVEWIAIGCIIAASAGTTWGVHRARIAVRPDQVIPALKSLRYCTNPDRSPTRS